MTLPDGSLSSTTPTIPHHAEGRDGPGFAIREAQWLRSVQGREVRISSASTDNHTTPDGALAVFAPATGTNVASSRASRSLCHCSMAYWYSAAVCAPASSAARQVARKLDAARIKALLVFRFMGHKMRTAPRGGAVLFHSTPTLATVEYGAVGYVDRALIHPNPQRTPTPSRPGGHADSGTRHGCRCRTCRSARR